MSNLTKIESSFSFRTQKDTGFKRPTVAVYYPGPSIARAIALLSAVTDDGKATKEAELALSVIQEVVTGYVRGLVDADSEFTQEKLDALIAEGKISFETIANLPATERNVLAKDDLEEFAKSYIEVMSAMPDAVEAKIKAAAGLFVDRFKRVAGQNDVLAVLQSRLSAYVEAAGEERINANGKALDYLARKLDELLSVRITADSL